MWHPAVPHGDSGEEFTREYDAAPLYHHSQDEVASFLEGLETVGPGITEAYKWRAPAPSPDGPRRGHIWAAVGHKVNHHLKDRPGYAPSQHGSVIRPILRACSNLRPGGPPRLTWYVFR